MHIDYAVSLWNYTHYTDSPSLERICAALRAQGYGIELWGAWRDERDLYDEAGRGRLRAALQGMPVSLHTTMDANTIERQQKQVDAAAAVRANVVVLHPSDLSPSGTRTLDVALARDAVAYARSKNVRLALENGNLPFLSSAIEQVDGLRVCLDVGHIYLANESMQTFLDTLKQYLIHLHIQDLLSPVEAERLPGTMRDHYIPGTGGIPRRDWDLVAQALHDIDFAGTLVFEVQPRKPLQTALLARLFMDEILG